MSNYQRSERHLINAKKALVKAYTKRPCKFCGKIMSSGALARHESTCLHDDNNIRSCKNCDARIFELHKITFCSRSCAATHNNKVWVKRKVVVDLTKSFNCLHCAKQQPKKKNSTASYCDTTCQMAHRWTLVKARMLSGDLEGIGRSYLRKFIEETRGNYCEECGQEPFWNGKPLTLEMDHISGDRSDNHPNNLRLLCPHCHTQTPTWGKKKRI